MAAKNRFIIKRKDKDDAVDDVLLESEGLTIGRLVSNDLVLNNRMVSRTHAGIKEIGKEFWLFNLSTSNGTNLNGELVEQTPLADGDVVQIGPFLIRVNYAQTALSLTVERELQISGDDYAASQGAGASGGEDASATIIMKAPPPPGTKTLTPGGTRRLEGTGILRAAMPAEDEKALDLFWKNRKREAGKIAERTPLHPRTGGRLGKFQFNWKPTADLARLWRKSYFYVGAAAVVIAAIIAVIVYESTYSPGPLSSPHVNKFSTEALATRNIADHQNANSCSNCHGVTQGMQDKCIDCHRTKQAGTIAAFAPKIYDAHDVEGMACSSCHTEHQGKEISKGLVAYELCANCHNGQYKVKAPQNIAKVGNVLPVPHGGTLGYPVEKGEWKWKLTADQIKQKGLPATWATFEPINQFHALHQLGRMLNRTKCGDCHIGETGSEKWQTSPQFECAKCHGVTYTTAGLQTAQVNCNSCHRQHGETTDLAKVVDVSANSEQNLTTYIKQLSTAPLPSEQSRKATEPNKLFTGTATTDTLRQNKTAINWSLITNIGAVPWYYWVALVGLLPITALVVMAVGTARRKSSLNAATAQSVPELEVKAVEAQNLEATTADIKKYYETIEQWKKECPPFPHPYVYTEFCIGCHACVDACPHDVLAIVSGHSSPIALDQCMEDTGCTVECPTSPKACILINGTKPIQTRKVPSRNQSLMTNVEGVYMVGDVSGTPLIKNAINEGAQVIDIVQEDLKKEGPNANAEYDVAIVGIGPAGLSAAVIAKQRGLTYVAIEQDEIVATIAAYPAGKYVFFKPDTVVDKGGIPLPGVGDKKEAMIAGWFKAMTDNGIVVNGEESCKSIKREGNVFHVATEKGKEKAPKLYKVRRAILAIGNRGTPQKLRLKGEEMNIPVPEEQVMAKHCPKCGTTREGKQQFCVKCGSPFPLRTVPAHQDTKVKYKLTDPDDYKGKKCIIVGAGNSAIEAAVDLAGFKRDGDQITFMRDNDVTLVVRSDLKGDLKLGNKMNLYDCVDAGKIKLLVRRAIKEIQADKVVLMDARSEEAKETLPNDFIFALIGGEKPTKFLESIGIKIG